MGSRSAGLRFNPRKLREQIDHLNVLRHEFEGVHDTNESIIRNLEVQLAEVESAARNTGFVNRAVMDLDVVRSTGNSEITIGKAYIEKCAVAIKFGETVARSLDIEFRTLNSLEEKLSRVARDLDHANLVDDVPGIRLVPAFHDLERMMNPDVARLETEKSGILDDIRSCLNRIRALEDEWDNRLHFLFLGNAHDPKPSQKALVERPAIGRFGSASGPSEAGNGERSLVTSLWGATGDIQPDDVNQFQVGDCFFAATVAGLAGTEGGRSFLKRIIKDNRDGTFTVSFSDGRRITVDGGIYAYANGKVVSSTIGADGAVWYQILEKAYAQLVGGFDELTKGGDASDVLRDFGMDANGFGHIRVWDDHLSDLSIDSLVGLLGQVELGVTMVASFKGRSGFHALSVVGFDSQNGYVYLRNPWGNRGFVFGDLSTSDNIAILEDSKDLSDEGVYRMDLDTFHRIGLCLDYAASTSSIEVVA